MSTASALLLQPQKTPMAVPVTEMTPTRIRAEKILTLAPMITRDSMSLPNRSVPNQCSQLGGWSAAAKFCS